MDKLIPLLSIFITGGLLYLLSNDRKNINWKRAGIGLIAQFMVAFIFLKVPAGQYVLQTIATGFQHVIAFANEGLVFVFGSLSDGGAPTGFIFAIQVLGTIVFFGALFALLQYVGVLGALVTAIGGVVGKLMGTTKAESFVAVANIFLGQTESPLLVKNYIGKMTKSEIMTVLVAGMGSIAGSVLVGYSVMGIPLEYLLLASVMVPIGAIVVSKILQPETEVSELTDITIDRKAGASNFIDAVSQGAMNGMQMALAVGASLIAVVSLVAMLNGFLGMFGLSLEQILSTLFLPFGAMLGVSGDEIQIASQLLGEKMVLNEFIAFTNLSTVFTELTPKAQLVISISLAGFANISSIAICASGIGVIAPEKRDVITKLATKGMIGGVLVSFLSALIVGVLF